MERSFGTSDCSLNPNMLTADNFFLLDPDSEPKEA